MAYLGNSSLPFDPTRTSAQPRDAERFSGNGSTTAFTLSRSVSAAVDIEVFVENVQQEPIVAYDVNGTSLTFTGAPPSGTNNIYVVYRNFQSGAQVTMPDGSVTYSKLANNLRIFTTDNLTPNGNNAVFTLSEPPADANTVMVTVDGVVQRAPVHYTTSGSTITFTSNPPAGSNVHVRHLGFRTSTTVTALAANSSISQPNIASPTISSPTVTGGTLTSSTLVAPAINGNVAFSNTNSLTVANTGGSTLLTLDSVGRMITPFHPLVSGGDSNGNSGVATLKISSLISANVGNHYNGTTGVFTCPIAGRYLVMTYSIGSGSSQAAHAVIVRKNGSQIGGLGYNYTVSNGYNHVSVNLIVECAANDTLDTYHGYGGGGGGGFLGGYNNMSIYFLG